MRKVLLLLPVIILLTNLKVFSNEQIKLSFKGEIDSLLILANYYGNSFQVYDTIELKNNTANIILSDSTKEGVYTLAKFDKSKIIDFVIGGAKGFSIEANTDNLIDSVIISNSIDNKYFFKYLQLNSKQYNINKQIRSKPVATEAQKRDLEFEINYIQSEIQLLKNEVRVNLPNSVLDLIFTSMQEPEIPFMIKDDRQKSYQYFKSHYWDLIALNDIRMIRTPVFHNKIDFFFDRIVLQHPDSIYNEFNNLLSKEIHPEIKKYLIWNVALKYEEPKIMGLDKVFVEIVDNYFLPEISDGLTQSIVDNFKNRANKMRHTLIGEKAPNLIMVDTTGNYDALLNHFNSDFTLVVFWSSDCQTCQKELKELKKLIKNSKHDIEVFAVGTDMNLGVWKKYIRDNELNWVNVNGTQSITKDYHELYNIYSTPTIFVLDKNQKIIGKNLIVAQLENLFNHHAKLAQNK